MDSRVKVTRLKGQDSQQVQRVGLGRILRQDLSVRLLGQLPLPRLMLPERGEQSLAKRYCHEVLFPAL